MVTLSEIVRHISELDSPCISVSSFDKSFHHIHSRLFLIDNSRIVCCKIDKFYDAFIVSEFSELIEAILSVFDDIMKESCKLNIFIKPMFFEKLIDSDRVDIDRSLKSGTISKDGILYYFYRLFDRWHSEIRHT